MKRMKILILSLMTMMTSGLWAQTEVSQDPMLISEDEMDAG